MIWPSCCLNINVWKQFWGQNNPLSITTTTEGRLAKNEQFLMIMIKIVDKMNKQGGQNNERGRWSKTRLAAKNLFGGQFSKRVAPVGRKGGHQQLETQIASCFDRMIGKLKIMVEETTLVTLECTSDIMHYDIINSNQFRRVFISYCSSLSAPILNFDNSDDVLCLSS